MGKRKREALLDGQLKYARVLGEGVPRTMKIYWDHMWKVDKEDPKKGKFEKQKFMEGLKFQFDTYICSGKYKELVDLIKKLSSDDLSPENLPRVELWAIKRILEDEEVRTFFLDPEEYPGRLQKLREVVDDNFKEYFEGHKDDENVEYFWRDIHDQLLGIEKGLPIDDY